MSNTNNNMGLVVWNDPGDPFDYTELAGNFTKIANHDHSSGKGVQIDSAGIKDRAINNQKIYPGAVSYDKIAQNTIKGGVSGQIALNTITSDNIYSGTIGVDKLSTSVQTQLSNSSPSVTDNLYSITAPVSGQEVYYKLNTSCYWHLKYVDDTTGWVFLGGSSWIKTENAGFTTADSSFNSVDQPNGQTIFLPYGGIYKVEYSVTAKYNSSTSDGYSFGVCLFSEGNKQQYSGIYSTMSDGNQYATASGIYPLTVVNNGASVSLAISRTNGPSPLAIANQIISITPITVKLTG